MGCGAVKRSAGQLRSKRLMIPIHHQDCRTVNHVLQLESPYEMTFKGALSNFRFYRKE